MDSNCAQKEGCQFWRWADSWEPKEEHAHGEEDQRRHCNWRVTEQKIEGVGELLQRHWKATDRRMEEFEESLQRHWKAMDQRMEGFELSLQCGCQGMEERIGRVEESLQRNCAEIERRMDAVQVLLSRFIKVAGVAVLLLLYLVLSNRTEANVMLGGNNMEE